MVEFIAGQLNEGLLQNKTFDFAFWLLGQGQKYFFSTSDLKLLY